MKRLLILISIKEVFSLNSPNQAVDIEGLVLDMERKRIFQKEVSTQVSVIINFPVYGTVIDININFLSMRSLYVRLLHIQIVYQFYYIILNPICK